MEALPMQNAPKDKVSSLFVLFGVMRVDRSSRRRKKTIHAHHTKQHET